MTARVFGSIALRFYFVNGHVKLNSKLQLNGVNDIQISSNHQKYVPREKSLGWTVSRIIGDFKRGILNGVVLIKTNVSTHVWATVKNGILHGPCVVSGITYRIDSVRIIERLLYQINICIKCSFELTSNDALILGYPFRLCLCFCFTWTWIYRILF